ncbi:unnamed protein product [Peniophora sp. CBMAI 1063]|nr:unnamed protein product [Peniophora sp. CBMAI 1063]
MGPKTHGKRPAKGQSGPSKKRKLAHGASKPSGKATKEKSKGKDHAYDRPTIEIPQRRDGGDSDLSEEDMEMVDEYGSGLQFLTALDEKGIARSKKETIRLHQMHKPVRQKRVDDDLPSIHSHSSDEEWDSDVPSDFEASDLDASDIESGLLSEEDEPVAGPSRIRARIRRRDSDGSEMSYEAQPRRRRASWSESENEKGVGRLPIKLADGSLQQSAGKVILDESSESSEEEDEPAPRAPSPVREDVSTGARFGRPAVADVLGMKSRKAKVLAAKEQIAGICQEIIADPENSLGLLRRLNSFSLPQIVTPSRPEPVPNDPIVRKLAILSQLAVFKDIIPGYRIRALTDKEKEEKVSQMVARTREWEQGLVNVYQQYLKTLESELKAKAGLEDAALQCMCTLLADLTHFNFRVNLMSSVVGRLSKRSWDDSSELCLKTIISVFKADVTGVPSLEVVRLLNRMVKERRFKIHPDVLGCLLSLRLKTELGIRSSETRAEREPRPDKNGKKMKNKKGSTEKAHLSKKAKKVLKERQEIEKEMKEADAEVDREERAANQTETLKLLFVLYFRVLKNPTPTPLLPAALQGISRFAHLVSIDFFKDLLAVLRELIVREGDEEEIGASERVRLRLACIVTAFELLSGQGEALTVDLSDFVAQLYALILPLSVEAAIDVVPPRVSKAIAPAQPADALLFRALHLAFSPRSSAGAPPWRAAAVAKRLLGAALHWPPATAIKALDFVEELMGREPRLEALLSSEDCLVNGVYRPEVDDPQLSNPFAGSAFELAMLAESHADARVREAAIRLQELPIRGRA